MFFKWYCGMSIAYAMFILAISSITQLSKVTQTSKPINEPSTPSVPVDVCEAEIAIKSGAMKSGVAHTVSRGGFVWTDLGKLVGNYSETGIDTDGDGLYNHLKLSVEVEIPDSSLYNLVLNQI